MSQQQLSLIKLFYFLPSCFYIIYIVYMIIILAWFRYASRNTDGMIRFSRIETPSLCHWAGGGFKLSLCMQCRTTMEDSGLWNILPSICIVWLQCMVSSSYPQIRKTIFHLWFDVLLKLEYKPRAYTCSSAFFVGLNTFNITHEQFCKQSNIDYICGSTYNSSKCMPVVNTFYNFLRI